MHTNREGIGFDGPTTDPVRPGSVAYVPVLEPGLFVLPLESSEGDVFAVAALMVLEVPETWEEGWQIRLAQNGLARLHWQGQGRELVWVPYN